MDTLNYDIEIIRWYGKDDVGSDVDEDVERDFNDD
jgi:hypothetical protein